VHLAQKPLRLCVIRIAQIRHVTANRLNVEFELHVVGIAEDQRAGGQLVVSPLARSLALKEGSDCGVRGEAA
jgi:hypothetical protein